MTMNYNNIGIRMKRRSATRGGMLLGILLAGLMLISIGCSSPRKATASEDGSSRYETSDRGNASGTESSEQDRVNDALRVAASAVPEEIEEFEVDGLKIILRPTDPSYHTVVAKLYIRGGLPALPEELSPAIEQLALDIPRFSGPANVDRSQFRRETDRMRTEITATAERDFSTLMLRCVDENFDPSWEYFAGVVMNPGYDETETANIKERTITAIRNRRVVPEAYAQYLADSVFFYGHPYGRVSREDEVIDADIATVKEYRKKMFVKSRLFMVVVGNVTREEITQKVRATLAKLPEGSYTDPTITVPQNATVPSLLVRKPWGREDIPTNYLVARHLGPWHSDSLFYAMQRLRSYVGGFLFREIRINRNLSYAPDANLYDHRLGYGDITISTVLPDSAWRVTKNDIIDFFQTRLLTEETLENIPSTWFTSQYISQQTAASQAQEIGAAYFYTGDWRTAYQTLERFSEVTPEALNEAAVRYLRDFSVVIVGNPEDITVDEYLPTDDPVLEDEANSLPGARSGGRSSRHTNSKRGN